MLLSAKIGAIEFVDDEVRVAVVKTGGRTPVVLEVQSRIARYAEEEDRLPAMVVAVGEAVDALKNPPVVFILCANGAHSIVRAITIPIRGRKRVLSAAQFELEPHLAFPIDELLLDFNIVAEVDGETEVLAVGVRRRHLEEQRTILEEAGIEVDGVNLDSVALTGLWRAGHKAAKGLEAVLHVREKGCSLAVLFNGKLAYFRNMPVDPSAIVDAPGRVAREIQNTLRAFLAKWRGGGEIDSIHVTGLDMSPGELDGLSSALRLPVSAGVMVETLKGGGLIRAAEGLSTGPNAWEAVIGTAFAGAGGALSLNFDAGGATQSNIARSAAPHIVYTSAMALVGLLLWGGYYYIGTNNYKSEAARLQKEVHLVTQEIEALEDRGLGEGVNADFFLDPPMLEILDDIGKRMPDSKVTITQVKVFPPGTRSGWILISGSTPVAENVGQVVKELEQSKLFRLDPDMRQELDDNVVRFTVNAHRITEGETNGDE